MQQHNAALNYLFDKGHWDGDLEFKIFDVDGVVTHATVPVDYQFTKHWESTLTAPQMAVWMSDVASRNVQAKRVDDANTAELQAAIAKKAAEQQAEINALKNAMASRKRRRVAESSSEEEEQQPSSSRASGVASAAPAAPSLASRASHFASGVGAAAHLAAGVAATAKAAGVL